MIAEVKDMLTNPNVSFKVCSIAMKNNRIEKRQLLPGVQVVPDDICEFVSKQQEHWRYITAI
jgi:intracellular sulfur oxidation DsrE/DsrF family protein